MTPELTAYLLERAVPGPTPAWFGRRRSDGLRVVVRVHTGAADERDSLARRTDRARVVGDLALVLPVDLLVVGPDLVVVEPWVGALVLEMELDRGLVLAVPRVVEVLRDLCRLLQRTHDAGLVHGSLRPTCVLMDGGTVIVRELVRCDVPADDLVLSGYTDLSVADEPVTPAYDVYAVAAIGYRCLTGRAPVPGSTLSTDTGDPDTDRVLQVLVDAMRSSAPARVTAAELAQAVGPVDEPVPLLPRVDPVVELLRAAPPLTVRAPARVRRHQRPERAPRLGWRLPVMALAVLLVVAALAWMRGAAPPEAAAASAPSSAFVTHAAALTTDPVTPTQWEDYLSGLYAERALAFTTPSVQPLATVFVPGSAAMLADVAAVGSLVSSGGRLIGFAPQIDRVQRAQVSGVTATVDVVDLIPAYQETVGAGPAAQPGRGATLVRLTLQRHDGRWLIATGVLLS